MKNIAKILVLLRGPGCTHKNGQDFIEHERWMSYVLLVPRGRNQAGGPHMGSGFDHLWGSQDVGHSSLSPMELISNLQLGNQLGEAHDLVKKGRISFGYGHLI